MASQTDIPEIIDGLRQSAKTALGRFFDAPPLAAVLWGSIIDVADHKIPYSPAMDIDVLVICDNVEKLEIASRYSGGMPSSLENVNGHLFDVFFADFSYVEKALSENRWTVTRAISQGPVIFDGPALDFLKRQVRDIVPFSNNNWDDWRKQSINLMGKASKIIDTENYKFADVLMRDALNTLCYARIFERQGYPVTPSNFGSTFSKYFSETDLFEYYMCFQRLEELSEEDIKLRYLSLSEVFVNAGIR